MFYVKVPFFAALLRFFFHKFQFVRGVPRLLFLSRKLYIRKEVILLNTPDGIPMFLNRNDYGQLMNFFFDYCLALRKVILDNLKPGDVFLDLGSNTGIITFDVLKVIGKEGYVLGVDCNKTLVGQINDITKKFSINNCLGVHAAIAGSNGSLFFNVPESNSESGEVSNSNFGEKVDALTIYTLTEKYCSDRKINFIKIDIEGMEVELIDSLSYLLERDRPILLIEFHPQKCLSRGNPPETVRNYLKNFGYSEFHVKEGRTTYELYESNDVLPINRNILYKFNK